MQMQRTKKEFEHRCNDYMASITVAIGRKARGSTVEHGYFLEKIEKLNEFFLDAEVIPNE